MTIIRQCSDWFRVRNLKEAVVGFSGGIDSATTIALLSNCGIHVHIVVAEAPNQKYSSSYGGNLGAKKFIQEANLDSTVHYLNYPFLFSDTNANEAASPIFRVALFYGVAAKLRSVGRKVIVVGTVNFDEASFLGFWGKSSDGAQDFYPLSHLHKSEVLALAKHLKIPHDIIHAVPSGDLLFESTNDLKMIGADYDLIEKISVQQNSQDMRILMDKANDPMTLRHQILSNSFKYDLSFPGFHLSSRLEDFRRTKYRLIYEAAKNE